MDKLALIGTLRRAVSNGISRSLRNTLSKEGIVREKTLADLEGQAVAS